MQGQLIRAAARAPAGLGPGAALGALYAGLVKGGNLASVWRSTDNGDDWSQLANAPNVESGNAQGVKNFSIVALWGSVSCWKASTNWRAVSAVAIRPSMSTSATS